MNQEDKHILFNALCAYAPYNIRCKVYDMDDEFMLTGIKDIDTAYFEEFDWKECNGMVELEFVKPILRPMSSMTKKEKRSLIKTVAGSKAIKFFDVDENGTIHSVDPEVQNTFNFNFHWINFSIKTTVAYLTWLNSHHFDYNNLIEKGLALEENNF